MRPTVLIVDDSAVSIDILSEVLDADYEVVAARDGIGALELAASAQPALIVLDIVMPGIDGYETCRRLKADPATADIPVIFVTGLGEAADEEQGFAAGAADYLTKPFSPPIIRCRVATHLKLKEQRDLLRESISRLQHEAEILQQKAELGIQAGCLAHDLSNILNSCQLVEFLPDCIPDSVPEKAELQTRTAAIMHSLKMGCDICRGYTSYLRHIDEAPWPQPLVPLLDSLDMYTRKFRGRVTREISKEPLLVACKGHQMQRVFNNLFTNAMQAVTGRDEARIHLRLWADGPWVRFSVGDNGPGIAPEIRARIFEERFTSKRDGTGLGLFLVKQIIEAHAGTVEVESTLGKGATFTISLPRVMDFQRLEIPEQK